MTRREENDVLGLLVAIAERLMTFPVPVGMVTNDLSIMSGIVRMTLSGRHAADARRSERLQKRRRRPNPKR